MRTRSREPTIMYSGSRGILYTAPPKPDDGGDERSESTETGTGNATESAATGAAESADGAAADD